MTRYNAFLTLLFICLLPLKSNGNGILLRNSSIEYSSNEPKQVVRAIGDLQNDIQLVTDYRPLLTDKKTKSANIIIGTYGKSKLISKLIKQGCLKETDLKNRWESYVVSVTEGPEPQLIIAGSDMRGTIYGIYDVSQRIGVSPWYWWADVPVKKNLDASLPAFYYASGEPSVKYRGIFINDEDWGLQPWAAKTYEPETGDIGPKTYARVCELLLRLKANMLAPAMHPCTHAFYTIAQNKVVADEYGIMITTSHCEPLLLNNADSNEWNQKRDGDWNYKTNRKTILKKWDDRLTEASRYENIYTVAMRGLHDAGLRGNLPINERTLLLDTVIMDQRTMLEKHIGKKATAIPQIFVPYKETMDIYENGLKLPDDITLVWVDDNYGYMKRVANPEEQKRSGGSGVYYHLSYLGAPHDYLWLNTTPPALMYNELKKAYDAGADRYWLLNVGDIKPMELGMQTFFDMAWNFAAFDHKTANRHQASILSTLFGIDCQSLMNEYYRLAWSRKPEYMGWEYQWDDREHSGLKSTEFSFTNYHEAQHRLSDYARISDEAQRLSLQLPAESCPAFFELVQYPVQASFQMNRKFLMAQLNQELAGKLRPDEGNWAGHQSRQAYDSINALTARYNNMLNGKWRHMMTVPPGYVSLYHNMPALTVASDIADTPVDVTCPSEEKYSRMHVVDLACYDKKSGEVNIIEGMGYDWRSVQLNGGTATYTLPRIDADSVDVVLHVVPLWPLYPGKNNRVGLSVDGSSMQVLTNQFKEYSRTWKDQVMRNGFSRRFRFAVNKQMATHQLTLHTVDEGQIVQRVVVDWGGLRESYVGPEVRGKK